MPDLAPPAWRGLSLGQVAFLVGAKGRNATTAIRGLTGEQIKRWKCWPAAWTAARIGAKGFMIG
jgi:hypothetical protein